MKEIKKEIKFRAWDDKEKKMLYSTVKALTNFESTAMQFTGLRDRDGKEIYEGDIVKMSSWKERKRFDDVKKDCEGFFVVKVSLGSFGYEFDFESILGYPCPTHLLMNEHNSFKVVGNVYENPELL